MGGGKKSAGSLDGSNLSLPSRDATSGAIGRYRTGVFQRKRSFFCPTMVRPKREVSVSSTQKDGDSWAGERACKIGIDRNVCVAESQTAEDSEDPHHRWKLALLKAHGLARRDHGTGLQAAREGLQSVHLPEIRHGPTLKTTFDRQNLGTRLAPARRRRTFAYVVPNSTCSHET